MAASRRAFVLRHTALQPVPGLPGISLQLTDDVLAVWHALQVETGDPEAALPYWALAWGGGQAIARYLEEHPDLVSRRRVYDLASGSGLVAIAAAAAGADHVEANDVDPFAGAAIALNARANHARIDVSLRDALDDPPPEVDVVLTGDAWYNAELAGRVLPWLRRVSDAGIDVIVGDPGRAYLPTDELEPIATYEVRTTSNLEDLRFTDARVYRLRPRP